VQDAAPERATDGDLLRDVSDSELILNETRWFLKCVFIWLQPFHCREL